MPRVKELYRVITCSRELLFRYAYSPAQAMILFRRYLINKYGHMRCSDLYVKKNNQWEKCLKEKK